MTTEAEVLHRIISASVRDMLDAYRIQAEAGPVTEKALEDGADKGGSQHSAEQK